MKILIIKFNMNFDFNNYNNIFSNIKIIFDFNSFFFHDKKFFVFLFSILLKLYFRKKRKEE